jgi:choline kinase
MKAFLLTAGLGTRLRPLTNNLPKCLLPLGGKPLLEIWLKLLGKHGVTDVLVNMHWYADKVVDIPILIKVDDMQKVEDIHMIIAHMSMQRLRQVLNG